MKHFFLDFSLIVEKPKIASLENPLIYANIGDEVILPCDVSGSPEPKFKWVRRGGNFDSNDIRFKVRLMPHFHKSNLANET